MPACYSQLTIENPKGTFRKVPCLKCINCLENKSSENSIRVLAEIETYYEKNKIESTFLTLTYSEEYLPLNYSLNPVHLEKYWKKLRNQFDHKIKYFAVGEYGTNKHRPHYHAILIGVDPYNCEHRQLMDKTWKKGNIYIGIASQYSAHYVAKYTQKTMGKKYTNREDPFRRFSNGLGKEFCLKHKQRFLDNKCIIIDGHRKQLPTYFRRLLGLKEEDYYFEKEKNRSRKLLEHIQHVSTQLGYSGNPYDFKTWQYMRQIESAQKIYKEQMSREVQREPSALYSDLRFILK